jgi:hypothetical protein
VATQILALDGEGNVEHYNGDYTEYHDWKAGRGTGSGPAESPGSEARPSGRASSADRTSGSQRSKRTNKSAPIAPNESKRVKVIKKPRDPEMIEAEITELEKRVAELSEAMTKPEVARDITRLVTANDEYQKAESRLAELMDEWERSETGASSKR